jgi:hypothetical protein
VFCYDNTSKILLLFNGDSYSSPNDTISLGIEKIRGAGKVVDELSVQFGTQCQLVVEDDPSKSGAQQLILRTNRALNQREQESALNLLYRGLREIDSSSDLKAVLDSTRFRVENGLETTSTSKFRPVLNKRKW